MDRNPPLGHRRDGRHRMAERNPLRDAGEDRHPGGDRGWPISVISGEGQSPALELRGGERLDDETERRMRPRPYRAARKGEETDAGSRHRRTPAAPCP